MTKLLTEYSEAFRDRVLDLLWRQWTTLGVNGYGKNWQGAPIDPEALLLFTCTVARYDARLFDAMVEWMGESGRYINIQRLKRIISTDGYAGERVLRAVAATTSDAGSAAKWAATKAVVGAAEPEPLFFLKDGRPMPTVGAPDPAFEAHSLIRDQYRARSVVQGFRPELAENLILRLRSFLGVNARCEIITYLLLHEYGSPNALARDIYYFPLTISKAMTEMRDSGYLVSRINGRQRDHRLVPETWRELLLRGGHVPWVVWPRLFRAIEALWIFFGDTGLREKDALAQASALRRILLRDVIDRAETCNLHFTFGDLSAHPGESLLPFGVERVTALLDALVPSA